MHNNYAFVSTILQMRICAMDKTTITRGFQQHCFASIHSAAPVSSITIPIALSLGLTGTGCKSEVHTAVAH